MHREAIHNQVCFTVIFQCYFKLQKTWRFEDLDALETTWGGKNNRGLKPGQENAKISTILYISVIHLALFFITVMPHIFNTAIFWWLKMNLYNQPTNQPTKQKCQESTKVSTNNSRGSSVAMLKVFTVNLSNFDLT